MPNNLNSQHRLSRRVWRDLYDHGVDLPKSRKLSRENDPRYPSQQYLGAESERVVTRAVLGGTRSLLSDSGRWLPCGRMEHQSDYQLRCFRAVLYNFTSAAIRRLCSAIYKKQPKLVGGSQRMNELLMDVDGSGRSIFEYGKSHLYQQVSYGAVHNFVDAVVDQDGAIRPRIQSISARDLIGWRLGPDRKPVQVRWHEVVQEPDGQFGEVAVDQWVVLDLIQDLNRMVISIYREDEEGEPRLVSQDVDDSSAGEIRISSSYGVYHSPMVGFPVYSEMADLNLQHFWKRSDADMIQYYSSVIIMMATGIKAGEDAQFEKREPASVYFMEDPAGRIRYVQVDPQALVQLEQVIESQEARMATLANEPFHKGASADRESATRARSDREESLSIAQSVIWSHEAALQDSIDWMGEIVGDGDVPKIVFDKNVVPPGSVADFLSSVRWIYEQQRISAKTMLETHEQLGVFDRAPMVETELNELKKENDLAEKLGIVALGSTSPLDQNQLQDQAGSPSGKTPPVED